MSGSRYSISFFKTFFFTVLLLLLACGDTKEKQEKHRYTNALIHETSPYLLQHAHNPVDWRPWSTEALEEAKKKNKLVLISIGYSSCHWCHVMEEETFEDEEVAKLMNKDFVSIKVDREERPDVDQVYMTALQLMKGDGGWPLNVITLPNGKPIYGGTYHTTTQWKKVLTEISRLYKEDPEKANEYADMVATGIQEANLVVPSTDFAALSKTLLEESVQQWKTNWDMEWGGDIGNQKFMIPVNLDFLLDYAVLTDDESAKTHVKNTLDKMALGGIYDHIGGGFFRYSTDTYWKTPHFEKMLYDNAQMISLYSKAYKIFKKPAYKDIVFETIAFVEREMKDPEGAYYAAIDADSEGEEGAFYVWEEEELKSVLKDNFKLFASYYNISKDKVWENNKYSLFRSMNDTAFLEEHHISKATLTANKAQWHTLLLEARQERVHPNIDDKIITSWNALLINGFIDAQAAFGEREFLNKAITIFDFISSKMYKNDELVHSYKKGGKHIAGFLDDYAYLADASLHLYEVTLDLKYLDFAKNLGQTVEVQFRDTDSGMFRYNRSNELISKIIKMNDGVLPSPNSVMAHNLFRLGHINYDMESLKKAKIMLSSTVPLLRENAQSYAKWNGLLLNTVYPYYEIAVVGKNAKHLVQELNKKHLPNTLTAGSLVASDLPLFKSRFVENNTYIYVCKEIYLCLQGKYLQTSCIHYCRSN